MKMKVGIDTVELTRIEKSLLLVGFKEKVFSPEEIKMLGDGTSAIKSYAANFAAKEAFSKSLGTGIRGFSLNEISVLRDELGAPYLELSGRAKEAAKGYAFTVSLTHTRRDATAVVIAYEE